MRFNKKYLIFSLLLITCVLIHWYGTDTKRVELNYSLHFYPAFSQFLRCILGFFSFSLGDIFYGLFFCWLVWKIGKWIYSLFHPVQNKKSFINSFANFLLMLMILYLIFNVFWGLNYNRKGIAYQTQIEMNKYTPEDLKLMNELLVEKVNASKINASKEYKESIGVSSIFKEAINSYDKACDSFSYLKYNHPAVKSSMWGWLGNYLGYTGYYNPFTGEAQVNTTIPLTTQPFIVCHEIAHQLGYAKESEANFAAYLVTRQSEKEYFKYAGYLEMFFYANRNLYEYDSLSAIYYRELLSMDVKKDIKQIIDFNKAHKNPIEPFITIMYDWFLRSNQQPQGMMSYNQVTAFLIGYYRKFGCL